MKSWLPIYGLAVCSIIILCYLYFTKGYVEPFVTSVPVSNVSIPMNEIFLMAVQNPKGSEIFTTYKATNWYNYTNDGYTYADAQKICESVGATLADLTTPTSSVSKLSLQTALDLSGHWCAAGWTRESDTVAFFPVNDTSSCKPADQNSDVTTTSDCDKPPAPGTFCVPNVKGFGKYTPLNGKAYAICMGPKPSEASSAVNYFNRSSYSMYSENLMTYLTSGQDSTNVYQTDIFPVQFTPSQAYNALVNSSFNVQSARQWLVKHYQHNAGALPRPEDENLDIDNKELLLKAPDTQATQTAWSTSSVEQSCVTLQAVYNEMDTQLSSLTTLFSDLSGVVQKMVNAKGENALLQTTVTRVCVEAAAGSEKSAACSRLLSLDYDLFYRNTSTDPYTQTNLITNLESLNLALRVRQCEIQQALGSLQQILTMFKTTPTCATTLTNLKGKYKDNMVSIVNIPSGSIVQSNGSLKNKQGTTVAAAGTVTLTNQIVAGSIVQSNGSIKNSTQTVEVAPPGTVSVSSNRPITCSVLFNNDGTVWDGNGSRPIDGDSPNSAFKIGRDIQYNSVETLKVKLEEISPFFTGQEYASLANMVINQLSVMIRTPLPEEYSFIEQITEAVNDALQLITTTVSKI